MTGFVGAALHFEISARHSARGPAVVLPIGARVLAPMVEELHVLAFERLDLRLDERVELGELVGDLLGQSKSTAAPPVSFLLR